MTWGGQEVFSWRNSFELCAMLKPLCHVPCQLQFELMLQLIHGHVAKSKGTREENASMRINYHAYTLDTG
jgi:hypothetical protein